ncbi:MAG: hypothetical protein U0T74_09675 [Chitinophagales bacterium]
MIYKTHLRAIAFGAVLLWGAQSAQGQDSKLQITPCMIPNEAVVHTLELTISSNSYNCLKLQNVVRKMPFPFWSITPKPQSTLLWRPEFDSIIAADSNCSTARILCFAKQLHLALKIFEESCPTSKEVCSDFEAKRAETPWLNKLLTP